MHRLHLFALAAVSTALAAGCGSDPKPVAETAGAGDTRPSTTAHAATPPPARQDTNSPTSGSIHIDDKITKACGNIPAAHFAFDSAAVQADASAALDALARCFSTGPLAGRNMLLTGHTDTRGEREYNIALGQRRAGSVSSYLSTHGMTAAHLSATSHGDLDATGTDEAGWARDRKVDVTLVD
jgi:peptidoglycan-associated lipoprotein